MHIADVQVQAKVAIGMKGLDATPLSNYFILTAEATENEVELLMCDFTGVVISRYMTKPLIIKIVSF